MARLAGVSCYAARIAAIVQCPSFGGSAPTADVACCLASSDRFWCTGSTPTAGFRDRWLGLLRCRWHALPDWPHVLCWTFHPALCTARLPPFFFVFTCVLVTGDR